MRIKKIIVFILPVLLILWYYKNLILNLGSSLGDWLDSPFVIWVFQNNIKHFMTLDIKHLFDTNAMYPFTDTLSFTEHMFLPSLMALFVSFINKSPIFQFNAVVIINHLLTYISFYLLSTRFTKNFGTRVLVSFFAAFNPYFVGQMGHLQMVMVWPMYVSLYFLLAHSKTFKNLMLCGLFFGLQFYASVYLGLMGLFVMFIYELSELVMKRRYSIIAKEMAIIITVFAVVSSVSLYGYLKVQSQYKPHRGQEEFVTYSAHLSDYILSSVNNSLFNRTIFTNMIGKYNRHISGERAAFIGTVPLVLIGYWAFKNRKKKLNQISVWLLALFIFGIVFSIGPRANWNGSYLVTPLPYYFVLKIFPPIGIMRAVARWYFIAMFAVNVGLLFTIDYFIKSVKTRVSREIVFITLFILLIIEFYPMGTMVSVRSWASPSYLYLQKACKSDKGAVLEFPFEYRDKAKDIGRYLSLKTNALLSSTLYSCPMLGGYSSFEPPLFKKWQQDFDTNGITEDNLKILKAYSFKYIRLNLSTLNDEERKNPGKLIHTKNLIELLRDSDSILYKITY